MKFLLFFSFLFLLYCMRLSFFQQEKNHSKYAVIKNFAVFLFIFFYVALARKTTFAATWSFTKKTATFTVTSDEIFFEQDDNNYYFTFDTSNNPYGYSSNSSFVVSQRSDLDYLNHTTTVGSSAYTYKTYYKAAGESVSLGTFSVTPKANDVMQVGEYPSFYVFDTSVTSSMGIDGSSNVHTDVRMVTIDRVSKFQVPKSKIHLFRYINFFGTKEYSGNPSTSLRYGLSNAVDLMSIVNHECDFKIRYLDETYHDYYCDICHWAKDKSEHSFDLEDAFGYSGRKCACGSHNKVTMRLSVESSDGKNISIGDAIDFSDTYKKIEHKDIIGTPNSPFDLGDLNINERPGYIFLGLDPPLPDVFPSQSIEFKLIYRPIEYKVLYSHDNLSKLNTRTLEKSLTSRGSARELKSGEVEKIEEEYNISLSGLVYCMVQDCVYDREFSLPAYRVIDYAHDGWGSIKNNFYPLYKTNVPVKNLTLANNDVIVLNPVFTLLNNSGTGSDNWNGDSGGSREDGNSDIIHHGDNEGPGGGGAGGGGAGGGGAGGASDGSTSDGSTGDGSTGGSSSGDENANKENVSDDGDGDGSRDGIGEGIGGSGASDGDTGGAGDGGSGGGGTNAKAGGETILGNNTNLDVNKEYIDLDALDAYELEDYLSNLFNIKDLQTLNNTFRLNSINVLNSKHSLNNFGKNSFMQFLNGTAFAQNFEDHLEKEKLRIENLKKERLAQLAKLILERTLYFLAIFFIVFMIWDRRHKQKVKKYI